MTEHGPIKLTYICNSAQKEREPAGNVKYVIACFQEGFVFEGDNRQLDKGKDRICQTPVAVHRQMEYKIRKWRIRTPSLNFGREVSKLFDGKKYSESSANITAFDR